MCRLCSHARLFFLFSDIRRKPRGDYTRAICLVAPPSANPFWPLLKTATLIKRFIINHKIWVEELWWAGAFVRRPGKRAWLPPAGWLHVGDESSWLQLHQRRMAVRALFSFFSVYVVIEKNVNNPNWWKIVEMELWSLGLLPDRCVFGL